MQAEGEEGLGKLPKRLYKTVTEHIAHYITG
jgi:hypothetical protein